ncbi:hypothetical protein [Planktosalinus lacus]|uniref:Uncharacterized protein n=1 Tax=Planktosalinus lacus TaxID=1526573 RepID=A0A8J2VA99_9FLAO|nr:hypothetical protein [Planktosalinus lacus]GGD93818.1 hypothetical protein GCM10011312_16970 [Planktosalinus lacus]
MNTKKSNNQKKETKDDFNSNLTKEEKEMLNEENIHKSGGDDLQLRNLDRLNSESIDFEGKDLDVPGRSRKRKHTNEHLLIDEENELHSQGGNHKELERNQSTFKENQNNSKK